MVVVTHVDLRIKEWKGQPKIIEPIPISFLTLIVQLCTDRTKNILQTSCISLHMTPNMANITQLHGYMKKGTLRIRIGHNKIYV